MCLLQDDDGELIPVDEGDGGEVSAEEYSEAGAGEEAGAEDEAVDRVTEEHSDWLAGGPCH